MTKKEIAALDGVIYHYKDGHLGELLRDIQIRMKTTHPQCELLKTASGTVAEMQIMDFITEYDTAVITKIEDMLEQRARIISKINTGLKDLEDRRFPDGAGQEIGKAPPPGLS